MKRERMKYFLLTLLTGAIIVSHGFAQTYERKVEKKFEVDPNVSVFVNNRFGSVVVKGGDANIVAVKVTIKIKDESDEDAKEIAEGIDVSIEGSRNKVTIETGTSKFESNCNDCSRSIHVSVLVPKSTQLNVMNSFGSTKTENIFGKVDIDGKFGAVDVTRCANISVKNSFGSTNVNSITGSCRIENKNGKIRAFDIEGGEFMNAFGATEISGSKKPVTIESKMGSVKVKDMVGGSVANSYGSVEVWLNQSFSGHIEAKTAYGSVKSDIPLTEREPSRKKKYGPTKEDLIGSVGTGSATIALETKFGDLTIRK